MATDNNDKLNPIKNQDLENNLVDSSNIKVAKHSNFFIKKLKDTFNLLEAKENHESLELKEIIILTKLRALNKVVDFNGTLNLKRTRFYSLITYFNTMTLWLEIVQSETSKEINDRITTLISNFESKIKTKNKILGFFSYSKDNINNTVDISGLSPEEAEKIKKVRSLNVKEDSQQVENIIFDTDSGLVTSIINNSNNEFGKSFYLTIDKEKVFPFRIEENSPIKISFDKDKNEFIIGISDSFIYESKVEESDVIITHNFNTRNLNIHVYNIKVLDGRQIIDFSQRTHPNVEYISDNEIKLLLSSPSKVYVQVYK